jgi:NAD-dependent SIR2 family protein deacetylase
VQVISADDPTIQIAAQAIRNARALVIATGAGMGVDSGLPDFRGRDGFWKAYPPYRNLGVSFTEMANPAAFARDPQVGWGFYGHRLELYRRTRPHAGFDILRNWAEAMPDGWFVFTSNVDGHFQQAGFDPARLLECHGSIHHLQCLLPCDETIWPADGISVSVNETTMRAQQPLPSCPKCGGMARPNILMFGDAGWIEERTEKQERRYRAWLANLEPASVVIVELGAGNAVPTVRFNSERIQQAGATLVRINPREAAGPRRTISIATGALDALRAIDICLVN